MEEAFHSRLHCSLSSVNIKSRVLGCHWCCQIENTTLQTRQAKIMGRMGKLSYTFKILVLIAISLTQQLLIKWYNTNNVINNYIGKSKPDDRTTSNYTLHKNYRTLLCKLKKKPYKYDSVIVHLTGNPSCRLFLEVSVIRSESVDAACAVRTALVPYPCPTPANWVSLISRRSSWLWSTVFAIHRPSYR